MSAEPSQQLSPGRSRYLWRKIEICQETHNTTNLLETIFCSHFDKSGENGQFCQICQQARSTSQTNENRPQFHFFECSHTLSRRGKHSDAVGASAFRSLKYYFPINLYVGDTQFFELVSAKLGKIPNTSNESNLRTSDFKFGHSATGRREFPSFPERNTEE